MSAPEQHLPPVHACASGAVSHAHAGGTLEPAVLLHTEVPPALRIEIEDAGVPRVDISSDGPLADTLTLRVLVGVQSVSWQLPITPFIAALPGQLGDDGRMVLLAVVDGAPDPGFWSRPVDCEDLAVELSLPVADLAEALQGRLISWLSADLEELLHLDAHDRVSAVSPAQTLANAVIAHYRGDLSASGEATKVVRALELGEPSDMVELGARLSSALAVAVGTADEAALSAARDGFGPFESEALRLLDALPTALADVPTALRTEVTMQQLVAAADRDEAVRAAVGVTAALARASAGPDLDDRALLALLGMVDDAGLVRLARLWVSFSAMAQQPPAEDLLNAETIVDVVGKRGIPAVQWLHATGRLLAGLTTEVAGRQRERVREPLEALERMLAADDSSDVAELAAGAQACLQLARFVRQRTGIGPGGWLVGRPVTAAAATGDAVARGTLDVDVLADLLVELLDEDVEAPDLLDAFLCASSMVLVDLDPQADPALREAQVSDLLGRLPGGAKGSRWMLDLLLREAPDHDPMAVDLRPLMPAAGPEDPDRTAERAGRLGVVRVGLASLLVLAEAFGEEAHREPSDVLGLLLATGLENHDLLRRLD